MRTDIGAGDRTSSILDQLKRDHRRIMELFDLLESTEDDHGASREQLFGQLAGEIESHSQVEDDLFYATLEDHIDGEEPVEEAREEHEQIDQALEDADQIDVHASGWLESVRELRQVFQHHIAFEEATLFALARRLLNSTELERLGYAFFRARHDGAVELEPGKASLGESPAPASPSSQDAPVYAQPGDDGERDEIERMSKKELYDLARQRKIEGRSAMTKAELLRAIRAAGRH